MPLFSAKSEIPEDVPAKRNTLNHWSFIGGRSGCARFSTEGFTTEFNRHRGTPSGVGSPAVRIEVHFRGKPTRYEKKIEFTRGQARQRAGVQRLF
jgi:hypothetical protein